MFNIRALHDCKAICENVYFTYSVRIMKRAITMKLSFIELSLIDDSVREPELSNTLGPIVLSVTCKITS